VARGFWHHVVGGIQIDRIDLRGGNELDHLYDPGGAGLDMGQVMLVQDDIAVLLVLEAFDQFRAGHRLILGPAVEDLLDARMVATMEVVKADGFAASGSVQFDRERNDAEGDVTLPNSAGHVLDLC